MQQTFYRRGPKLTPQEMADLYTSGRSIFDISILCDCSAPTVRARLVEQGVTIRPRNYLHEQQRKVLNLSDAEICQRYEDGSSTGTIAVEAGCGTTLIKKILAAGGVRMRTPAQTLALHARRSYRKA
jgi:hypothetical protein